MMNFVLSNPKKERILKKQYKEESTYNKKHKEEKYLENSKFLSLIQPKNILDLFSGKESFYINKGYSVITNDTKFDTTTYSLPADKLVNKLLYENQKFDLIDIDPFGSAFDCFDGAIKMAQKGLIITFGEIGHRRWKRLDFVSRYYRINSLEEFTIENLIEEVKFIGIRNKKMLTPVSICKWRDISRVYFKIVVDKPLDQL